MATKDLTIEQALSSPMNAYLYARDVIKGRFPEGEAVIAQDPQWAYMYAVYVIKRRWPKCEPAIFQDHEMAPSYYRWFKDQFTEREKVLWLLKV